MMTIQLTYIGGPTVLIEGAGVRLLTDPTLEPAGYKYFAGPQEVAKTASPALSSSSLEPVDVVLLSHDQHTDNLDPAGRSFLARAGRVLTTPVGAQRLGDRAQGVATWETVEIPAGEIAARNARVLRVTATPARHGPAEVRPATGDVNGWILDWDAEPRTRTVYISGDTVLYDGVESIARRSPIAIALLNMGAAHAERFGPHHLTFTAAEAVDFARLIPQTTIVPLHYEGWTHYTEGRSAIEQTFHAAGLASRLRFLPPGEPVTFEL